MNLHAKIEDGIGQVYTTPVFQYSEEVLLWIENMPISIPANATISNNKDGGNAVMYSIKTIPFAVPKEYFENGQYVYVWFESIDRQILIVIPVMPKSTPVKASEGGQGGQTYEYDEAEESINIVPANFGIGIGIEENESEENENG